MINKHKLNFARLDVFNSKKLSANAANTAYRIGMNGDVVQGEPDVRWQSICFIKDANMIYCGGKAYRCLTQEQVQKLDNINVSWDNDTKTIILGNQTK